MNRRPIVLVGLHSYIDRSSHYRRSVRRYFLSEYIHSSSITRPYHSLYSYRERASIAFVIVRLLRHLLSTLRWRYVSY